MSSATRISHPVLFGLASLVAIIELGITARLTQNSNREGNPSHSFRDKVRFNLFTSLWTLVFSGGLIAAVTAAPENVVSSIFAHNIWVVVTFIFWLSGAAALSALRNDVGCGFFDALSLCTCATYRAAEAFAWIETILFLLALLGLGFITHRAIRGGNGLGGPLFS